MSLNGADIGDIQQAIELLYSSNNSDVVLQVQKQLQELQKSPRGLVVANQLLQSESLNCRYFGALTYTVNIRLHHMDQPEIHDEDSKAQDSERQSRLIHELMEHLLRNRTTSFLVKKLLSNLALLYISFHREWTNPLVSLYVSLRQGTAVLIRSDTQGLTQEIDAETLRLLLLFSQILVEEVTREEHPLSAASATSVLKSIHSNIFPITSQLLFQQKLWSESLECLTSWIQFVSIAEHRAIERYDLNPSFDVLLNLIAFDEPSISSGAIDVIIDILDTKPALLNKDINQRVDDLIFSSWAIDHISKCKESEEFDVINNFSRLITLYLELDVMRIAASLASQSAIGRFEFLIELTNISAKPIDEELVSKDFLEFWSELAEAVMQDEDRISVFLHGDFDKMEHLKQAAVHLFNKLAIVYWNKIHIPDGGEGDFSTYKGAFLSFRRDVADFFELFYPLVGASLFENLVSSIGAAISSENINVGDIEASLYLLNSISASLTEKNMDENISRTLEQLLNSQFLHLFKSELSNKKIEYAVHTMIQFFSGIDVFYKTQMGQSFLPEILDFLFNCVLQSDVYQLSSSKAISRICDECRSSLAQFTPNFESILVEMINNPDVKSIVRERITKAYTSLLQGSKSPERQGKHLHLLLSLMRDKIFLICDAKPITYQEIEYVLSLLSCLSEAGRGMQALDEDEEVYTSEEATAMDAYWAQDPYDIHGILISILNKVCIDSEQSVLLQNPEVNERCCLILKKGLTETLNGPFKLHHEIIIQFIMTKLSRSGSSSAVHLFSLLESVICAYYQTMNDDYLSPVLDAVVFDHSSLIEEDPDSKQAAISVLSTTVEKKPILLLYNDRLVDILRFCLSGLESKEKFLLKATSKLWSKLIQLKKGSKTDHEIVASLFIDHDLGYQLTYYTLTNLLTSARSDLDSYQEILKLLVAKYPLQMKAWAELSFKNIIERRGSSPLPRTDLFLKKMLTTRGRGPPFANVVKEFWLESNGLTNY